MRSNKLIAKPFVKWVGGKGQLITSINKNLPFNFNNIQNVTYVEPFVGGGAMLFYMLQNYPNIKEAVINDINEDLVTAYRTVRDNPTELIAALKNLEDEYLKLSEEARKEFFLDKRTKFNTKSLSAIDNTMLFIFLNRTCFNGLYRVNSRGLFNVPFGRYDNPKICDHQTIIADSKLLQRVEIMSGDYANTEQFAVNNAFFYFDPPYRPLNSTSTFNSYSRESFDDVQQIRLRDYCIALTNKNCQFILSNSDCSAVNTYDTFFDDIYSDFVIDRVWASRSVNSNPEKRGKLTELLIRNYTNTQQLYLDRVMQGELPFIIEK